MIEIKDIYGNVINEGDIIAMPQIMGEGYANKIVNGYYVTKVFYNKERDKLVDDNNMGFIYACGVVKLR